MSNPPGFGEFLLMVRKEESRQTKKRLRMRMARSATADICAQQDATVAPKSGSPDLEATIQQLTSKIAALEQNTQKAGGKPPTWKPAQQSSGSGQKKKKIFCYKCGLDGHKSVTCRKEANPTLVHEKLNC
jgi:hypothetical protein